MTDSEAIEDIEQRSLPEQDTAVMEATVTVDEIGAWISSVFGRVAAVIAAQRVEPAGPPFARYSPEGDQRFHVEAGFPVHRPIEAEADVHPSSLPAGPVISTVHVGPYDQVSEAYARIERWAAEHGVTTDPHPWEIYVTDPISDPDPASWRTAVVVPVTVT